MKKKLIGFLLLLAVIVSTASYKLISSNRSLNTVTLKPKIQEITLNGLLGSGKIGLMEDEQIKNIFRDRYGIDVNYSKAGSLEMVVGDTSKFDFLFPSSQVAYDTYKETQGKRIVKSQTVFNTPLVFFSWDIVTDALVKNGMVQKIGDNYFVTDFNRLLDYVSSGKKWSDIGVPDLYGRMTIYSTDPTKSSSGVMFAGLMASVINGDVVDENSLDKVIPKLKSIYKNVGYMESSSSDLFDQYLRTGVGAKPIIVAYENQIVEFSLQNPEIWNQVKDKVRIIYPIPTMWSPHSYIALNGNSLRLLDALEDKEVQKLAWEKHGFRTGILGIENDPKVLNIAGIPKQIDKVIPSPKSQVMEKIIKALQEQ